MSCTVSEPTPGSALEDTAALVHRLRPIRDLRMRSVVMARYLISVSAERAVRTLVGLLQRGKAGQDVGCSLALESLVAMLGDDELLPYATRASLYATAKELGHLAIARFFFDASPNQRGDSAGSANGLVPEWKPTPSGRALTLGERKSLARGHRRDVLRTVLRDPHAEVIRILLGNPTLTESDVLLIASRRPCESETLAVLASDTRFGTRYTVRRALVKNPYTPAHLAIRLLTSMRRTDLATIAEDRQLAEVVREQARALLE
jgi:hypothetical protein